MKTTRPITFLFLGMALIGSITTSAQDSDTSRLYFKRKADEMTGKVYVVSSRKLLCRNPENADQGIIIWADIEESRHGLVYSGLMVASVGIGSTCVENSEMIFLFEDGSRVITKAWNKFNCKGISFFDLPKKLLPSLCKPIKAIRFTHGRTHESYTHQMTDDKEYFIEVQDAIAGNWILSN